MKQVKNETNETSKIMKFMKRQEIAKHSKNNDLKYTFCRDERYESDNDYKRR